VRAQIKVVLLVAVILAVTLSAILWKTQSLLVEDKMSFINDSAMKQLAPLRRLVSEKLDNEKNDLVRFATSREAAGAGHVTSFGVFDAIALVEVSAAGGGYAPAWIEKGPSLRAEKWTDGYDMTLLKSLPYQKVKDGSTFWVRLSDAQGAPLYAVLNSVDIQSASPAASVPVAGALPESPATSPVTTPGAPRRAIIVGFASENPLASVTEDYIGSTNSVYLVDDRGYVASHTKSSYLGSLFADDKLTQEIAKTAKVTDTRETNDVDGQKVIGHFERIDRSNLAAVITTPIAATTSLAQAFTQSLLYIGGLVSLLSLLAAYLLGKTLQATRVEIREVRVEREPEPESASETARETENAPPAALAAPIPVSKEALAQEASSLLLSERRNAFEAFNAGLAARLREPLLAILGHAQLAKEKAGSSEVKAHTESIEREARLAKEAIERFQVLEENTSLGRISEDCDLEKVIVSAFAEKAIEIEGSGITLEHHLTHVPRTRGRAADIEALIVHLLENAIEAMRDRPIKKLTVQLTLIGERVRLLITDTGIGMTRDVQSKAFEPFFKAFESPRHMGLGLAFVQTTLNRVGASVQMESALGEGTMFTIEFPVEAEALRDFEKATAPPAIAQSSEAPPLLTLGGKKPLGRDLDNRVPPPVVESVIPAASDERIVARDLPMHNASPSPPENSEAISRLASIEAPPVFELDESNTDESFKEFTISSITNPAMSSGPTTSSPSPDDDGFRVKIRRPKPRGT
jgi:signal transduction histidine kinase